MARRKTAASRKRGRRTDRDLFLDTLNKLVAVSKNEKITNQQLLEELGWTGVKYERVRDQFLVEGKIEKGRGRGGTIGPTEDLKDRPLSMFVSYAHADEEIKNELLKHLSPLKRMNLVDVWHDRQIEAGEEWKETIFKELEGSDIVLLLVSIDFINSEFCYEREMERAMERHDSDEAVVIPIMLRKCLWQQTPFAKLQALPKDAHPIMSSSDRDEAFVDVASAIQKVAMERTGRS